MFISTNFYEKIFIKNTNNFPVKLNLALSYDTDFRDIFEVKGINVHSKGLRAIIEGEEGKNIILRYEGLDNVIRRTEFYFKPSPVISTGIRPTSASTSHRMKQKRSTSRWS